MKVWKSAGEYKPHVSAPLTWMFSIARYQAIDLLRRRRHEVLDSHHHDDVGQIPCEDSTEDKISANSYRDRLEGCLRKMDSDHRQIFALAYLRGLTHMEVAQQTALPMGTVKTWIRRGLKSLRLCMHV